MKQSATARLFAEPNTKLHFVTIHKLYFWRKSVINLQPILLFITIALYCCATREKPKKKLAALSYGSSADGKIKLKLYTTVCNSNKRLLFESSGVVQYSNLNPLTS